MRLSGEQSHPRAPRGSNPQVGGGVPAAPSCAELGAQESHSAKHCLGHVAWWSEDGTKQLSWEPGRPSALAGGNGLKHCSPFKEPTGSVSCPAWGQGYRRGAQE
ncbi:actin-related protein T3 [Platysternon megacephalum]|uniref:Actin-related protein T3 n=1 Tax=Platysternon megacephalum TaxID=55544 RepID=A0A4D9ETL6_9SAUR|nr:actin-related protein T3 [Platysternon megacephalum]